MYNFVRKLSELFYNQENYDALLKIKPNDLIHLFKI